MIMTVILSVVFALLPGERNGIVSNPLVYDNNINVNNLECNRLTFCQGETEKSDTYFSGEALRYNVRLTFREFAITARNRIAAKPHPLDRGDAVRRYLRSQT